MNEYKSTDENLSRDPSPWSAICKADKTSELVREILFQDQ